MANNRLLISVGHWTDISYRMLRIRTVVVMITFEAIGYETIRPTGGVSMRFLLTAIMLGALYMSATCFNDVADEEVDKVNLAHDVSRPLVTTEVTSRQLRLLGIVSLLVALLSAILVAPVYSLFVAAGAVLSMLYSLPPVQLSHRGILASLWLPLSYVVLPFLAGALIQGTLNSMSLSVLAAMYVCFIGRILLKDFRDYEGDLKFDKRNFLVRHGPKMTCIAAAVAWLAGDVIFYLALAGIYPVLALIIQPMIVAILYSLWLLAYEKKYSQILLEVLFVGRLGNAIALALLTALTLQAFDYSVWQNNITIVAVGVFMAFTAVGLWRDSALEAEIEAKQPKMRLL